MLSHGKELVPAGILRTIPGTDAKLIRGWNDEADPDVIRALTECPTYLADAFAQANETHFGWTIDAMYPMSNGRTRTAMHNRWR